MAGEESSGTSSSSGSEAARARASSSDSSSSSEASGRSGRAGSPSSSSSSSSSDSGDSARSGEPRAVKRPLSPPRPRADIQAARPPSRRRGSPEPAPKRRRRTPTPPRRERREPEGREDRDRDMERERHADRDRDRDRHRDRDRGRDSERERDRDRRERRSPGGRGVPPDERRGSREEARRRDSPGRRPAPRGSPPDRGRERDRSRERERRPERWEEQDGRERKPAILPPPPKRPPADGRAGGRERGQGSRWAERPQQPAEPPQPPAGEVWGVEGNRAPEGPPPEEKEPEPDFGLSGALAEETNKVNGVVLVYQEPPEGAPPQQRWRLYTFKGGELAGEPLHIHRQSSYLFGRERRVADIPADHPSCSKQHAVLQYRRTAKPGEEGMPVQAVRPYLMDLGSTNGTFINGERLEAQRFYELMEKDVVKLGNSSREYVLLHEGSHNS